MILRDLVIIFTAVMVIIPIFRLLHTPPLVGFLFTGILIGPYTLGFVHNTDTVQMLAEVGVVLLLFTIGLEFPLSQLKQMRKIMFVGGSLQVIGTLTIVAAIIGLAGMNISQAIFMGMLVSLSSTAIVTKILTDRYETRAPYGRISLGILVFQDLAFVPLMILLPVLAGTGELSFTQIIWEIGVALLTVTAIVAGGRYLIPWFFHRVVRLRSREVFVLAVVLVVLGTAWLTSLVGLSLALGSFLAGLLLSESDYSYQITADVLPMRDALGSLFFISIGMLLDVGHVTRELLLLAGTSVGLMTLKFLVVLIVVTVLKYPIRTAALTGLSLVQVGEFSFILAREGLTAHVLEPVAYQNFLTVTVITMLVSPFLMQGGPSGIEKLLRIFPALADVKKKESPDSKQRLERHVVIVGYGLNGKNLATVLKETGIQYLIVDLDADAVRKGRAAGEPIIFGDATRPAILSEVNVQKARVLVIALSDPVPTRQLIRSARSLNPQVHIIVRTHRLGEMDALYKLGADQVIPEEFETSIEIFIRVMREYHLPRNVITAQVDLLRQSHYGMMRGLKLPDTTMNQIESILAAGTTDTFLVLNESMANGRTLRDLNLRNLTGASVIAIVRKDKPITNPSIDFGIETGDILVLIGSHAQIDAAFDLLSPTVRGS